MSGKSEEEEKSLREVIKAAEVEEFGKATPHHLQSRLANLWGHLILCSVCV